jgi:transglutaminase-like putative cysteine protease
MAREQDAPAGRQRLLALGAVAALCTVTALAFGRVFIGRAPTWALVATALGSVLVAGLTERRGLAVALLASAVGLTFAITWFVFPQTSWYGLPTLRTLRAVGRSLEVVAQQTRVQVAPSPPLPPLMLAAVTAIWTSAFSTHALAIRSGSPLLAVLPSVALVGFADTVLDDGARPIYAIAFLLAALSVVFVDGLRRVRQWGPVWASRRGRRLSSVAARGARQVAAVAVLTAVLVPWLLPGFRSDALVDFSTDGDGIRLDPFVSIQAQLERDEPVDLFAVTSDTSAYWRLYSLDRFDGTTWSSSDPDAEGGIVLSSPAQLPVRFPPGAPSLSHRVRVLRDLDDPWLPMAYPAERVTLPDGELRYEPDLASAVLEGGLDAGFEYLVDSRIVAPEPRELDPVRFDPPEDYGRYTFLPAEVDPRVAGIAREWAGGEATPYRQVLAIQEHLTDTSEFEYSLDVEPVADADAMMSFLTETRRGFCQQFATTMAAMVRALGYPSRVAVGFRNGEETDSGTFVVTSRDAHAWVEVYFPGFGWLPFEPTPGRVNPVGEPGTYLNPISSNAPGEPNDQQGRAGQGLGGGAAVGAVCSSADGGQLPPLLCRDAENAGRIRGASGQLPPGFLGGIDPAAEVAVDEDGYTIPYRWILLGVAAVVLLVLVFAPVVKGIWRRRMIRRSRPPRELVLAAYRVFDGEAADLGLGRREGETLEEHRARLSAVVELSDGHLSRLTTATARAAYSVDEPSREEATGAVRDARTAITDLRKDAGWVRRIVGTYRPGL